ncbi:hypothetical protein ACWDA7_42405 [Streptomyces sp. NPDC001156]
MSGITGLRRLPWTSLEGKREYAQPGGILAAVADSCEESMVKAAREDFRRAQAIADDECSCRAELREAIRFLSRATEDAIMVAELRGERLPPEEPMTNSASSAIGETLLSRFEDA